MDLHKYRTILMGKIDHNPLEHHSTLDPISVLMPGTHRARKEWRSIIFK